MITLMRQKMKKTISLLLLCGLMTTLSLALAANHVYSKIIPVTVNNLTLPNNQATNNVYVYVVPNHTPSIKAPRNHPVTKNMPWINCTYNGPYSECISVFGILNNNKNFFGSGIDVECRGTISQFKQVKKMTVDVVGSAKGMIGATIYAPPLTCFQ